MNMRSELPCKCASLLHISRAMALLPFECLLLQPLSEKLGCIELQTVVNVVGVTIRWW